MNPKNITINEVLRHSMHDFLNNMHLIQMNLDMGRPEEAKQLIHRYSQKCAQFFDLNNLGLLKTNEWLQTFPITYSQMTLEIQTSMAKRGLEMFDYELESILDRFVQAIYPKLQGYQEQILKVHILSDELLEVIIEVNGDWSPFSWIEYSNHELFTIERLNNTEGYLQFKLVAKERLE
ncbi:MAG: Spo0B domain-containing protein [Psychrobacillus sp.]